MQRNQNFVNLGKEIISITKKLTNVEDRQNGEKIKELCKLLYYPQSNPLKQPIEEEQVDKEKELLTFETKEEARKLIGKNIKVTPKIPDTAAESYLVVLLDTFASNEDESLKTNVIRFDIFCPMEQWLLSDNLRPFDILHRIDSIFNGARLEGIGLVAFQRADLIQIEDFAGYAVFYQTADFN